MLTDSLQFYWYELAIWYKVQQYLSKKLFRFTEQCLLGTTERHRLRFCFKINGIAASTF